MSFNTNDPHLWDETVALAKGGDNEAFSLLVNRFGPALQGLLIWLDLPENDREDLRQEGLIGLYKAVMLYDPALSSFPTFARLCMRSAVLDGMRKCTNSRITPADEEALEIPAAAKEDPQRILLGKEALEDVLRRIDSVLSPLERRIIGLSLQGKSGEEIASLLGKSRKSVENALFRCRSKLSGI